PEAAFDEPGVHGHEPRSEARRVAGGPAAGARARDLKRTPGATLLRRRTRGLLAPPERPFPSAHAPEPIRPRRAMNFARVARLLGAFSLFFTGVTLVPLVVAWFEPSTPYDTRTGFGLAAIVGGLVSAALYVGSRRAPAGLYRREGLTVVGLAWVIAGLLGALPLLASGALTRFSDAIFESVSGLTTTGGTAFGGAAGNPAIEALPNSLLLWRSMLQWVGGTGVI